MITEYGPLLADAPKNARQSPLVPGCNYHTSWQSHPGQRFVLDSVKGSRATLYTRTTGKRFKAHLSTLIFIESRHNIQKAEKILRKQLENQYHENA